MTEQELNNMRIPLEWVQGFALSMEDFIKKYKVPQEILLGLCIAYTEECARHCKADFNIVLSPHKD